MQNTVDTETREISPKHDARGTLWPGFGLYTPLSFQRHLKASENAPNELPKALRKSVKLKLPLSGKFSSDSGFWIAQRHSPKLPIYRQTIRSISQTLGHGSQGDSAPRSPSATFGPCPLDKSRWSPFLACGGQAAVTVTGLLRPTRH